MGAFEGEFAKAAVTGPQPLPLSGEKTAALEYPVEALGPVLGGAVRAAVAKVDLPVSIAAQSALAACSLALQGHFDVRLPTGQQRPTSLSLVTVAESGDRKSTCDDLLTKPIRDFERDLEDAAERERMEVANEQAAWEEARKAATQRNKNHGKEALKAAYDELGPRPSNALEPTIIVRTGTTQGLIKRFVTTRPSLGLMSDEGGSWIGGYGMSEDNRLNTIAILSDFWDGKTVQMHTAGEGYIPLRGRRLTFHMMVQPIVAGRLLGDAEALGQGFLSRLLVTHPESIAGTRLKDVTREPDPEHQLALDVLYERMSEIVRAKLPVEAGSVLTPKALPLDPQAELAWWGFYNDIEAQLGPDGELRSIKGFVGKLPEQAARLAAILAVFEGGYRVPAVDVFTMRRGIELARFYMTEALRLFGQAAPNQVLQDAEALSTWLKNKWDENLISIQAIRQRAPSNFRKMDTERVRGLIEKLIDHDHLSPQLPDGGVVGGKPCRAVWRVQVRNG